MMEKRVYLTEEGLIKVEDELDELKSVARRKIALEIQSALCCGDIVENSEYDRAKNEQAQLEERISRLEGILDNSILIDETRTSTDIISIGSRISLKEVKEGDEFEYLLVGSVEANPFEGKISNESPLGKALIGSKKGDIIKTSVPDGIIEYEILNIEK